MISVLIVDDEERVREGLSKFVPWKELGCYVSDGVESVKKALEILETEEIDVVLTDIMMPGLTGLDLISEAKKKNYECKFIILSGYGEFEYAQRALRLGAVDFLTKPVNFDDLNRVLLHAKSIIEKEQSLYQEKQEYYHYRQMQFLNNMVKGLYSNSGMLETAGKEIGLHMENSYFSVLRIYIPGYKNDMDIQALKTGLSDMLETFLRHWGRAYAFDNDIYELTVLFLPNDIDDKDGLLKLQESMQTRFKRDFYIGVGRTYNHIFNAQDSYQEAGKALEYRIVKKGGGIIYYEDDIKFFKSESLIKDETVQYIIAFLTQSNLQKLYELLDGIFDETGCIGINVSSIYETAIEYFIITNKYLSNYISQNEKLLQIEDDNFILRAIMEKNTIADIRDFLKKYTEKVLHILEKAKDHSQIGIIKNVQKYINEHYNEQITLNKLSEIFYLNPIYLSKMYKDKTGENFIDYLTRVRVEKSKKLLQDMSLKIYQVSEMVGYDSAKYFSRIFRELTGMTPKEYRNSVGIEIL